MAPVSKVLRTCGLLFYLILKVYSEEPSVANPWIVNLEVEGKQCLEVMCKYLVHVRGAQFLGHFSWRLTPGAASQGSDCGELYPNYEIKNINAGESDTRLEIDVPNLHGKIYFCLQEPQKDDTSRLQRKYIHQGAALFLDPKNDVESAKDTRNTSPNEKTPKQNVSATLDQKDSDGQNAKTTWVDLSHDIDVNYLPNTQRSSRKERDDAEVLIEDDDVPLNEVEEDPDDVQIFDPHVFEFDDPFNYVVKRRNGRYRYRREIINKEKPDRNVDSFEETKTGDDKIIGPFDDKIDDAIKKQDHGTAQRNQRQTGTKVPIFTTVKTDPVPIVLEGLRIETSATEPVIIEEAIPSVLAGTKFTLRLFGQGLTRRTVIAFTHDPLDYGQPCKFLVKGEYMMKEDSLYPHTALYELIAPEPITGDKLYLCAKNLKFGARSPDEDQEKYVHMGYETWTMLATHNSFLPLWATLILIIICLIFSALFSGLNLGLMSLDRTELKIISNTGTDNERKYSRAIMPVRDHGNYLLCSILLGNVAVNSTFTILLDGLTSGLFAVILSTLAIVLLGEITPQAICSRHGLMIGAKTIMVTKAVMALTAPMAYPVSKLLDYFLGEEIGSVYNRERLKELVKVTTDVNDLDKDEVNIISGALELRKKTVSDVMTKLEDAFMLPITSILDFETMSEIIKSGYSRIPVYEGSRVNVVTVLFIKDLAFVDPDDNTPLKTLCQYYQNPCNFVFEDVTLDVMFRQFKEGHKGHMAFIHRINNEGEGDPFYETIGLVTLEDVIEEMIQAEIVDETDVFMDNRTKRRRNRPQNKLQDFAAFAERHENQRIHISPQLTLATFQFLSTSVDAFRPDTVSETVLRRLLKQDVIQHIKVKNKSKRDACTYVFQQGKPVDYFVLILEGRVEVTVGRENLVFEAGPFTYFGVQALTQNIGVAESPTPSAMGSLQNINMDSMLRHTFVPDYSVRAIAELYYLTVKRSLYLAAKRATLMEKGALSKGSTNEQFDTEVDKGTWSGNPTVHNPGRLLRSRSLDMYKDDIGSTNNSNKLLQSVDEDISISGEHKTPSRQVSPNPLPVSASPHTRSSFARSSPEKIGDGKPDEQEKLLK